MTATPLAQDVMTTAVVTVAPDATVRDAAELMLDRRISGLPVTDAEDCVVGIVSEGDLILPAEFDTARVRQVMSSGVVSVWPAAPLSEVVALLEKHGIRRLPVIEAGRLVGIVSRADLTRYLATAPVRVSAQTTRDATLRQEVLKRMQRPEIDLSYADVTVEHGIVHLWGLVRSRLERNVMRVAASRVEGVRKVEDHTSVIPLHVAMALPPAQP